MYVFFKNKNIVQRKQMIKGSHNSMSYLKPLKKFYRWFHFLYRCQSKDIEKQYEFNVRLFDIHIYRNDRGKGCFKYGNVIYNAFSFYEPFNFLNKMKDCYVNLVLEETIGDSKKEGIKEIEDKFIWYCNSLQMMYPDIIFIGGYREFDGKVLYEFKDKLKNNEYILIDFV